MAKGNPTVVFPEPRKVVLEERELPSPRPGELVVKTRRTLISTGTELTILSGEFPERSSWADYGVFPFDAGYSNVGEVRAVGEGVDRSWVGRRVAFTAPHCAYYSAPVEAVCPLQREEVSEEEATFFALGRTTMNGVRRGQVGWGESVVIYGAGILGQLTAQFCRRAGARPVIVVDVAEARLRLLPKDVATIPLNPAREDVVAKVTELTRGRKADVVIELTGNQKLIPDEFKVLRTQGRFVLLSSPRGPVPFDFHDLCNSPSYNIIGAHGNSHPLHEELDNPWTQKRHTELFFDWVADREVEVKKLITHRESYAKAPELYHMLLDDRSKALGVILEWED